MGIHRTRSQNSNRLNMTSIEEARLLFPGAAGCVYLENSARGLLPITARDAALNYYDARIAGVAKETDPVFDAEKQACESFATLVGATHDEITLTRNVTDGLNIFVTALPWEAGDNAIVSKEVEHPNGVYALYNMKQRHGIEVRMVDAGPDLSISIDAIAKAIDSRTRLIIVSSVTFSTGARTDLAALGQLCHLTRRRSTISRRTRHRRSCVEYRWLGRRSKQISLRPLWTRVPVYSQSPRRQSAPNLSGALQH